MIYITYAWKEHQRLFPSLYILSSVLIMLIVFIQTTKIRLQYTTPIKLGQGNYLRTFLLMI